MADRRNVVSLTIYEKREVRDARKVVGARPSAARLRALAELGLPPFDKLVHEWSTRRR